MEFLEDIKGNIAVLSINCKMLGDSQTHLLHNKIKALITRDINHIIFNFDQVKLINSIGIGIIMACWSSLEKAGGQLKLTGVNGKVFHLLTITELVQFFEIHDTVEKALATISS